MFDASLFVTETLTAMNCTKQLDCCT